MCSTLTRTNQRLIKTNQNLISNNKHINETQHLFTWRSMRLNCAPANSQMGFHPATFGDPCKSSHGVPVSKMIAPLPLLT